MLTVACVWVSGHVRYSADYVIKLRSMVERFLPRPFQFVCLTDRPWLLPSDLRTIPIGLDPHLKGWWAKLELFAPRREWPGRVLYLDLDTLVVNDLQQIVDFPAVFALAPDGKSAFAPRTHTVVKRFNSSVMVWDGSSQTELYERWRENPQRIAAKYWGDQDVIGAWCPDAVAMPLTWFPRISEGQPPFRPDAKVVLMKRPKNEEAAKQWPWMREAWV